MLRVQKALPRSGDGSRRCGAGVPHPDWCHPRLLPIADGEEDRPKPRRGEGGWSGADRTLLPTPPPSFGWSPSPFAARTGRRRDAHNPPIVSISRAANPLTLLAFQDKQRHQPSASGPMPDSWPSRRWGGRRIQRPDVGGLWSSDEARGMDTSGVLMEVDGWPPFARRALPVRAAVSCPPRVAGSNVIGGDPVRPEARAASRRARGKRLRGAGAVPSRP